MDLGELSDSMIIDIDKFDAFEMQELEVEELFATECTDIDDGGDSTVVTMVSLLAVIKTGDDGDSRGPIGPCELIRSIWNPGGKLADLGPLLSRMGLPRVSCIGTAGSTSIVSVTSSTSTCIPLKSWMASRGWPGSFVFSLS